jgi:3-methyladenine DNA glycosylase AlkC
MEFEALVERVQRTQHGFTDILRAANEIAATTEDIRALAERLYACAAYQARSVAVYLWGMRAAALPEYLRILRDTVSRDSSWQVQEILAQAFDQYYHDAGYAAAYPVLVDWLADPHPNVRRAVTEGLRIWTTREHFKEHPEEAVRLLAALKADESEYVRKSVGNALRDISRKYPDLIRSEVEQWDRQNKRIAQTYKLACKFLTA